MIGKFLKDKISQISKRTKCALYTLTIILAVFLAWRTFVFVSDMREQARIVELSKKPRLTIWGYGTAAGDVGKREGTFLVLNTTQGPYHCYFHEGYIQRFIINMNRYFEANRAAGRVLLLKVSGVLTNHETALKGYKQLELCHIEGWE